MREDSFFRTEGVSFFYTHQSASVQALRSISLSVRKNEFIVILGPSGCGKTTLLKVLAGLVYPTSGSVSFNGLPVLSPSKQIGIIFQQNTLFPWLTVGKNILFALKVLGKSKPEEKTLMEGLITLVGLQGFEESLPANLSGGMRQRASLARSLATEPEILLLDEPFGSLDAISRLTMHDVLLDIWKKLRMTIIFVTHDVDEAVNLADRIFILTHRPGSIAEEIPVPLQRPRIRGGIVCKGFEDLRNDVVSKARELYLQENHK